MPELTAEEHKEFAEWFNKNIEIPDDVEAFDVMPDGTYVWHAARDGLVRWLEMRQRENN
jgi:hypothetical protein